MKNYCLERKLEEIVANIFMMANNYSNTLTKRPDEVTKGGKGTYCCIPMCGNSRYDRNKKLTKIGRFHFSNEKNNPQLHKRWTSIMKSFCRKGGNNSFQIISGTKVVKSLYHWE